MVGVQVSPAPPVAAGARRRGGLAIRLLGAVLGGVCTGLSWQPYALWPLLLIGLPLLTLAVRSGAEPLRLRRAFLVGYVFGLAMLTVAIDWIHVLGLWITALLIVFESLFFGLLGIALTLVGRFRAWPVLSACAWLAVEFSYARFPFGGFGWTRLAYTAVDTPLAGFFPLIGVAGVSFLVALLAQVPLWVADRLRSSRRRIAAVLGVLVAVTVLLGSGAVLRLVPPPASAEGTVNVGIVQGNVPGRGIDALGRMRSVTNNHLSETLDLVVRTRLGSGPRPDFILWPENSTDIDPTLDPVTRATVQAATQLAGTPILVGAVMEGPGPDERQTSALWWDPQRGILARYNKQNLVPFGEWIPFRSQLLPLIPILAEVGAQSVPGTTPGVLSVPVGDRTVRVGDVICFELAYDRTVYSTLTSGAQVLMVQSNNATYGGTGQIEQQFAITRARAMEARREIAVATTDSVSGYIDAQGRVIHRTTEFTAASMVVTMPLRSSITPAIRLAPWIDRGLAVAGLLGVLAGAVARVARRRAHSGIRDVAAAVSPGEDTATGAPPAGNASEGVRP